MTEQTDLIESSRESFEEKAFITYFIHCEKTDIKPLSRDDFLLRDNEGGYCNAYVDSLWLGWQWCYEICKTPVK